MPFEEAIPYTQKSGLWEEKRVIGVRDCYGVVSLMGLSVSCQVGKDGEVLTKCNTQ